MSFLLPRVYCAASIHRAKLWRSRPHDMELRLEILSTWHDSPTLLTDENDGAVCIDAWDRDIKQILRSEHLLVYAERKDRLNGTLVEIGVAYSNAIPIHLVGNYKWGTWRYLPRVYTHTTIHEALDAITFISKEWPA